MGIIKQAGDLVYTFRFLALLVTPFEKTKASSWFVSFPTKKALITTIILAAILRDAFQPVFSVFGFN